MDSIIYLEKIMQKQGDYSPLEKSWEGFLHNFLAGNVKQKSIIKRCYRVQTSPNHKNLSSGNVKMLENILPYDVAWEVPCTLEAVQVYEP